MRKVLLWMGLLGFFGCMPRSPTPGLILYNGNVFSLSWSDPDLQGHPAPDAPFNGGNWSADASAIAIKGSTIVAIGTDEEILDLKGKQTQIIDLKGAFVYPGFVDSHTHPFFLGMKLERVDLTGVESEEEAIEKIVARASQVRKGEWIIGEGFDEGAWANELPTERLLSERIPDHPVFIEALHGFVAWVNQMALEKAGITEDTPDPRGGSIGFYPNGMPNGLFFNNATELIRNAIPDQTLPQLKRAGLTGLNNLAQSGYTTTHHAGVDFKQMQALKELEAEQQLPIRVYGMVRMTDTELARLFLDIEPDSDMTSFLTVRAVKAFFDGTLGVRGAHLLEDYSDRPGHRGVYGVQYGFESQLAEQFMTKGYQMCIHAIGDAANRQVLDFYQGVYRRHPDTRNNRNRIIHAQVVHPDDFKRFGELEIIASMEPVHVAEDKLWAEDRLGPDRIKGAYAWRTLRENGARLVFNSNLPGSDHNIFYGLYVAITRKDKQYQPEGGWYPAQRMSPEEALRAYTSWPAYAAFTENYLGTIEEGKGADLSIVNIDILNEGLHHPERLLEGKVLMTIVDGSIKFQERL